MADDEQDRLLAGGFDTVAEALAGEDFPMDKQGLAYSVGDVEVVDREAGVAVPVRVLLDSIRQDTFASAEIAVRAIRDALERLADRGR